ncbi:hypothetical protein PENSPDRAFT_654343 [Peniophora sp. CONT]|nr:hypothetical protein PENSPDRAFT_654343 [Peniophora sp. CONT]
MELLNHITAPNVRNVDLVCFKFIAEIKPTLARLSQWLPGLTSSHPQHDDFLTASVIHDDANSSLTIALSRMLDAESGPFHFRVKADWEQRWATEGEEDQENLSATDVLKIIVPTIMNPYAASRVKHLSISLDAYPSRSLQDCISPFTSVSTLSLRGSATASCLVELMALSGTRYSPSMLFPELSVLHAHTMQRHHASLDDHVAAIVKSRAQMGQIIQWWLSS